ncbi:cytochrome-c oxidase, cbb3-type subunit II [Sulfurimonas sp.]|uniref:cytochrome-c oxidase, cbb3-type subunit II n=1 Tax=Sulfurimonas sp. TaxID=2022749 RepID=UPI00262EB372|nr:cytochrome-c oxidase, cbb3-type subunit II [Sulfurimonas sp.]
MFHWLEKHPFLFSVGVFLTIAFAGLVEIVPNFAQAARPTIGTKPYTLLQLAGRDVYIKNSCNSCHSQLIRPFKAETDRYGHYSLSGEYAYDRPFLWGSERTGPDLHRVGNYRTTQWHENHMMDPAKIVQGSIMPAYPWLFKNKADINTAYAEQLTDAEFFGVPYNKPVPLKDGKTTVIPMAKSVATANAMALKEAQAVVKNMHNQDVKDAVARGEVPEIVALIAYLNCLK